MTNARSRLKQGGFFSYEKAPRNILAKQVLVCHFVIPVSQFSF